jgi:hypothetical protein
VSTVSVAIAARERKGRMKWLRENAGALAPWVAGLVLSAPLLLAYYPPMTDFPAHEALVAILRNLGDTTKYPPGLYIHNFGQTQQLFHLTSWLLSYVLPVHLACKLVVAASLVAILVAASRLAHYLGRTPWGGLLVAPMAMGWTFYWGFVANLTGLACFLFSLPSLDRFAAKPTWRGALVTSGWCALQYATHEAPLFVLAGYVVILMVLRAPSLKSALWGVLPVAVAAALIVGQAVAQEHLRTRANLQVTAKWFPFSSKLIEIPGLLFVPRRVGIPIVALLAVLEGGVFAVSWKVRPREPRAALTLRTLRPLLERHRFVVLALACLFLYFAMPAHLNGATHVAERFFPPAAAILLIVGAPRETAGFPRLTNLVLAAIPLVVVLGGLPQYAFSTRIDAQLDEVLTHSEPGSAVANLDLNALTPDMAFHPAMHATRILSERGGRVLLSFADSSISPVIIDPKYQWSEALVRNNVHVGLFRPSFDLRRYRYVLLCTFHPTIASLAPVLFSPEAELVATSGPWILMRSKIWDVPLVSPDSRSPHPRPATLQDRIANLGLPSVGGYQDFDADSEPPPATP